MACISTPPTAVTSTPTPGPTPAPAAEPVKRYDFAHGSPECSPNASSAAKASEPTTTEPAVSGVAAGALELITKEAGLDPADMQDDTPFAALGIDSLMSLVISEKFRTERDIKVRRSIFLDYPTSGDLKVWLGGSN
jgi:monodictyphenone polyketide synthase